MKPLSFIVLFFYLSSLFPSVQFSAAHHWLEAPQTSASHNLAQLTSAASPVKHMMLSDDDDNSLVQLHHKVLSPVFSQTYNSLVATWFIYFSLPFSARAPPVVLS
ncbi:MAG: hypothetical protein KAX67_05825 [Pararheinheimera sp.]|jgi:hypothetical protein|nr:hypothetical protein [Rheinheimera sp.]